ncbi:hypothetical protein Agub_g7973, partial [Astrephomene gubernaculifera]
MSGLYQSASWFAVEAPFLRQLAGILPAMRLLPAQRLIECRHAPRPTAYYSTCAHVSIASLPSGTHSSLIMRWSRGAAGRPSGRPEVAAKALPFDSSSGEILVAAEAGVATSTLVLGCLFTMLGSKPTAARAAVSAASATTSKHLSPQPQLQQQVPHQLAS